jgi:hypothetical protein
VLSLAGFASGALELLAMAAAAVAGALALRNRLLPGWAGPPAWLATALLALAVPIAVAEVLGTAGWLEEAPFVVAVVASGLALRFLLAADRPGSRPGGGGPPPYPGTAMTLAGLAFLALVVAHFSIGTRTSLAGGMSGFDTTWYHGPFAAGFFQTGSTFDLQLIAPQYLAWFYPQNSELVHSFGMLAFGRDLLSPLLNLGWLIGCLAAAWCIGRPWGAGPVSLAGAALVLGSGALADQSGEARNDIVALFFLLAAVGIAANAWAWRPRGTALAPGALAIAGLAAGLAAGTKVNYLAPALALVAGLALLGPGRLRGLALAGLPALAGGGYWYLRNLVQAGNPLPWVKELGPISLPAPDQELGGREAHGIVDYAFDFGVWADWFAPGMRDGFGLLWPLIALAAAAGIVLCLLRGSDPIRRVIAVTALAAVAAWLVAPASAEGPEGSPVGFVSGLRYLAPALAIGLALLPAAPGLDSPGRPWAVLGAYALAMPFADASAEPWHAPYVAAAALLGVAVAAAAFAFGSRRVRALSRPARALGATALLVLALAAGYRIQRSHLGDRYEQPDFTTPGLNAAFAWSRDLSGERIATTTTRQYPFWGTDLSNRVRFVGVERSHGGYVRPSGCAGFRRAVNEAAPRFLVVALDRFEGGRRYPAEAAWVRRSPGARIVLQRPPAVVFELGRPLPPGECGARPAARNTEPPPAGGTNTP